MSSLRSWVVVHIVYGEQRRGFGFCHRRQAVAEDNNTSVLDRKKYTLKIARARCHRNFNTVGMGWRYHGPWACLKGPEIDQRIFQRMPPVALVQVPRELLTPPGTRGLRLEEPHQTRVPCACRCHVPSKNLFRVYEIGVTGQKVCNMSRRDGKKRRCYKISPDGTVHYSCYFIREMVVGGALRLWAIS